MNQAIVRVALAAACLTAVAGCSSTAGEGGGGNTLSNFLLYGGATVPPSRSDAFFEAPCPSVDVFEGGSAMRVGSTQIAIGELARECAVNEDKSISVKVGVEGRVLLGPGGTGGRYTAPVRINIKVGDRVLSTRTRTVSVAVPPGEAQAFFNVVEEGFVVPNQFARDYEIEVGLAGGRAAAPARRKAR
jgi:hypothetical protein